MIFSIPFPKVNDDCNDPNFQGFVVRKHATSMVTFLGSILAFHDPILPGQPIDLANRRNEIMNSPCTSLARLVTPNGDEGLPDSNLDLTFSIVQAVRRDYSMALFKGVIRMFNPDEIFLYKARTDLPFDIIFAAVVNGEIVYSGDVSGMP